MICESGNLSNDSRLHLINCIVEGRMPGQDVTTCCTSSNHDKKDGKGIRYDQLNFSFVYF